MATMPSKSESRLDLLDDCRLILEFALAEGKTLGEDLVQDIAELDQILIEREMSPLSSVPPELVSMNLGDKGGSEQSGNAKATGREKIVAGSSATVIGLLLNVHGALSTLISPATVRSLRATKGERRGWLARYMEVPAIVQTAIIMAFICMIGFILTLPKPDQTPSEPASTADGGESQ
jgi:hypothetical protein